MKKIKRPQFGEAESIGDVSERKNEITICTCPN